MEEIILEELLAEWVSKNLQGQGKSKEASDAVAKTSIESGYYWYILGAMKEACRQTLQLVIKDANMIVTENDLIEEGQLYTTYDDGVITVRINENSILDVLNKVK